MQMHFNKNRHTPWGAVQWSHRIAPGVVMVGTASHGGIWLSTEQAKKLPSHYEPFTKSLHWHEEDEDGGLVLQYLGLLSLIEEELTLEISDIDIIIGRATREIYYGSPYFGGPIVEAYKRVTGAKYDQMICTNGIMSPRPGGFRLANLCNTAVALMEQLDAGENIKPTTVTLSPYRIHEPKKFQHFLSNGTMYFERVSGSQAHKVLSGDAKALEDYISYRSFFPNFEKTLKIVHEGRTLYEKGRTRCGKSE